MRLALLLYKYFPYGGMQRDCMGFARELMGRGHRLRVYCIEWSGAIPAGLEVRRIAVRAINHHRRNERFQRLVRADLETDPVDGLVGFNKVPGLDVYFAADSCYLHKALHERGWLYRLSARYRHFAACERAVFGEPGKTQILLLSRTEQRKFEHHYATAPRRMHMLPPGIALDRRATADAPARRKAARRSLGLGPLCRVLLFVGSGFITKGLERAIRALAALSAAQPGEDLRLFVVGEDRERRFRRLAQSLALGGRVEFLGGRQDVPDLLLAADVLIHPALDEAAGIVLLEALVAGLPVLTTDVCGYAWHIEAARAGIVLGAPFEQQSLNQALERSLQGDFLEHCAANALRYAASEDLYSMHRVGAQIIERCLARPCEPEAAPFAG